MAAFAGAGVLLALLPLNVYVCEFTRMQGHKDTMIQCHNDVMIQGKKDAMTHSKMAIFKKSILLLKVLKDSRAKGSADHNWPRAVFFSYQN